MKLDVVEVAREGDDVVVVGFRHPRRPRLPLATPGAHVDLHLPDGRVRQYSLCGDPDDESVYRVAVKREEEGRGASRWLHDHLRVGETLNVSAPRSHFEIADEATRHVMIAGGIGITPFVPMVQRLARRGADFVLHYLSRRADPPFLGTLREACGPLRLALHLHGGSRFDPASAFPGHDPGTHVYCCGPLRLTTAMRAASEAAGWPDERLHVEAFKALFDEGFAPEPFEVEVASTGAVIAVAAERSLLDALKENGIDLPSSCLIGVCGSCECGHSGGDVIHRDVVLGPARRRARMIPCVSRARGRLRLHL